ncbi:MAG: DUF805 domain-containing protein [Flavobacteriaceae bacterium]|nr:MAG: DUF805 domain-containing protein [Flavobacteriaceae bacterium]
MKWFIKCLRQYADFNGRARRKEYWMFFLFHMLLVYPLMGLNIYFNGIEGLVTKTSGNYLYLISQLISFALLVPSISVAWRRMHDVNKAGWYMFIPFYGWYLLFKNGDVGANQYGLDPKNPTEEIDDLGKPELS